MKKNESGFSLVELMVVVGIIGILASLALPKLQVFMAKSKQSEAKVVLPTIFSLEQSYYADNNSFSAITSSAWTAAAGSTAGDAANPNSIGLKVTTKYFAVSTTAATTTVFTAQAAAAAAALCPGALAENWTINQDKLLLRGGSPTFAAPTCS